MKFLLLVLTLTTLLFSHPHVFVDVFPTVHQKHLSIEWVFDEMTSQMLAMDFDKDFDGKLSKEEVSLLYKEGFAPLGEYSYYTYFFNKDTALSKTSLIKFNAVIKGSRMVYMFEVKRPENATNVHFYDKEMFTSFVLKQAFVNKANPGKQLTLEDYDAEFYFGYILEL